MEVIYPVTVCVNLHMLCSVQRPVVVFPSIV